MKEELMIYILVKVIDRIFVKIYMEKSIYLFFYGIVWFIYVVNKLCYYYLIF